MISSKRTIKSLSALFIAISFAFAGNALVVGSMGVILKEREVGEFIIGIIGACFFIGASMSTISAHIFLAKIGHIRAFGLFCAVFAISIICHSLSQNLLLWIFLRLMLGYCYYAILMSIESWINQKAKNAVRSRVLSFYEVVFYLSFGCGLLLIGLPFSESELFIISACLIMFSSIPLNLMRIKEPPLPQNSPISLPSIASIPPLARAGSFIAGMVMGGFFALGSVFALSQGLSVQQASIFMFCAMIGGFLGQSCIGFISDALGRKFAIIISASVALLAAVLFLFAPANVVAQCGLAVLLGSGIFCLYSLSLARANDMLEDSTKRVEIGRSVLFVYSLGSLIAPLLLGIAMEFFGANGFMGFYALSLAFLIAFGLDKPNKESKSPTQNLKNFIGD